MNCMKWSIPKTKFPMSNPSDNMENSFTDEKDERFLELVDELDMGYYE